MCFSSHGFWGISLVCLEEIKKELRKIKPRFSGVNGLLFYLPEESLEHLKLKKIVLDSCWKTGEAERVFIAKTKSGN